MMDEFVKEVRALKRISVIIVVLLGTVVAQLAFQTQTTQKGLRMFNAYISKISDFDSTVAPFLKQSDYKGLLAASEKWLQKDPLDRYALYYRAMANYQLGNLEIARGQFEELSNLEPGWDARIQPYVRKMKEKLTQ